MAKFLVRVKEGRKVKRAGVVKEAGEEFEIVLPAGQEPTPTAYEVLEVLDENAAPVVHTPAPPVQADPVESNSRLDAKPIEPAKIIKTKEGSEIVDSFPVGSIPNPALLKAKIAEVEKAEKSGQIKIEEGGGAPAGSRFEVVEKSRGWYNVLDTETGAVLNGDKGLRKDDAEAMKAKLIDSAVPAEQPKE